MNIYKVIVLSVCALFISFSCIEKKVMQETTYYQNPIIENGADPWIIKKDDIYYYCASTKDHTISVGKSALLHIPGDLKPVWKAPNAGWNSDCIWAPELHYLNGRWYIYYAAGESGPPFIHQRAGVLESVTDDPQGEYIDKGMLYTGDSIGNWDSNRWAIDMTVFELNNKLYAVWSGWKNQENTDHTSQMLYIAEMENPWTISSNRQLISMPDKPYEVGGDLDLNEGPEVLIHNGDVFIIYSCCQSWLPTYKLASLRLTASDADPMNPDNWIKSEQPVFQGTDDVYGVGHASFTTSPDGTESYIVYHSKKDTIPGWNRDVRLQKFTWDTDGTPNFGVPHSLSESQPVPSGSKIKDKVTLTYSNPLSVQFGDPYILLASDGRYYMYGTGAGAVDGFCVYSSDDLISWKSEGQVYHGNTPQSWAVANFWAPEVYEKDGKFYMFFSADWRYNPTNEEENFRIGVAVADKPTGPFVELRDKPLFDPGYPVIDGNILQDENGKCFLYYSRCCYKHPVESEIAEEAKRKGLFSEVEESWIYGVEISPDFTQVIGEPVLLLRPPVSLTDKQSEWESRSVTSGEVNRRWTEGSFIFKHNGLYYMMYSANFFGGENYAVGYAVSESPLGPFKKADNNPVLEKNTAKGGIVTGTGHNSITWSKDRKQMYCVYHGRTQKTGEERVVFIDKMHITPEGVLVVDGPTTDIQTIE